MLFLMAAGVAAAPATASSDAVLRHETFEWSRYLAAPPAPGDGRYAFEDLREAIANGALEEAEIIAKQSVERANATDGISSEARIQSLQNLAVVQHLNDDLPSAILNYRATIDAVIGNEDHLSAALVVPLQGLAIAYSDNEQPVEAFETLGRALHISNVNFGPHSLEQVPVVESMMDLHYAQGDDQSGNDLLDRIYMVYTRRFGWESEELLPVLERRADEYRRQNLVFEERREYRHMLDIIRETRGDGDLSMIEPLMGLGRNFMAEMTKLVFRARPTGPTAEYYLQQAEAIAKNNPYTDPQTHIDCMLALADYYTLIDMAAQARNWYGQAWALMSESDSLRMLRTQKMERLNPLYAPGPDRYANFTYDPDSRSIDDSEYKEGYVVVGYSIDERGRAQDIEVIEAEPPDFGRMETHVTTILKKSVYRPAYRGGQPRAVANQRYRHDYFYLPEHYLESAARHGKVRRARQAARQAARRAEE